MEVHAFKLQGQLFLDVFSKEQDYHVIPPHYLLKVSHLTPTLRMSELNDEWLNELLLKNPGALRHQGVKTGNKPEDRRIRSLRGMPFWEAACHNFLKELRLRVTEPGTRSELEKDPDEPDRLLLTVSRPGATQEKYWIDPHQLQVIRGQLFENDVRFLGQFK